MKKVPALLVAALLVSLPAAAQSKKPETGIQISTTGAAPPNAKHAEIQDLRVIQSEPDDPYAYERYGLGAYQANDLAHARTFFEKSWKYGEIPSAAYNLACVDLKEKKTDDAWAHLEKAVAVGYDDEKDLLNDPDLASIRGQARFGSLVAAARRNRSEGDASVVKEGVFVAPQGRAVGILVVLHDAFSDPLAASGPFVDAARARGLFVAVPRGPVRAGKKRFGWGRPDRTSAAVAAALQEARRRAGSNLSALLVGIGRGGGLAFGVAAQNAGKWAGVGSVGGAWQPSSPSEASALRGARLFLGVTYDAPQGLVAEIGRTVDALKRFGLNPTFKNWPGAGATFPENVAGAVKDTLDGVMGTGAR